MHYHTFKTTLMRIMCGVVAAGVLLFAPVPYVFAESVGSPSPSTTTSCSPVAPAPAGIQQPTGSDASTYTYNSCTGLWENPYYTWNPATQLATPKVPDVYTCNTITWKWVTKVWIYDPAAHAWDQVPVAHATLPTGAAVATGSVVPCTPPPAASSAAASGVNSAGPTANAAQSGLQSTTSATITNASNTTAATGSAAVQDNGLAGDAASGNALDSATILNAVQSSSPLTGGNVVTFTANVDGNVQGDLIIDPSALQPASNSDPLTDPNVTVNTQTSGQINNDIALAASSGNATVADNTTGGNATTGSAAAIANVVNLLNSIVSAGKSFVGVININGNMNGNILVPQNFVNNLIASNAPHTTMTLSPDQRQNLGLNTTNNLSTTNNITSSAATGTATVANNTSAGDATTGNASTKVTVFNLTGSQIIGANCLLVFVNVAGTWVGVIMNAPAGATAAALGSGVTTNGTNNATLASATNNSITNNIDVSAHSGNADVEDNTRAGNATTGNATTAVNLLNINNADLSFAGWFGILFINVMGNWYGNFGVYTPQVFTSAPNPSTNMTHTNTPTPHTQVFRYVPATASSGGAATDVPLTQVGAHLASQAGTVLGASADNLNNAAHTNQTTLASNHIQQIIGIALAVVGLAALAGEQVVSRRNARRANS